MHFGLFSKNEESIGFYAFTENMFKMENNHWLKLHRIIMQHIYNNNWSLRIMHLTKPINMNIFELSLELGLDKRIPMLTISKIKNPYN